jgi:hypothetical protein
MGVLVLENEKKGVLASVVAYLHSSGPFHLPIGVHWN